MTDFLRANWKDLIMANYAVEPAILLPYLPKGVELDLYEGKAYVSLVGFMFKDTSIFGITIPFFGTFEEVNLRFYVVRKVGNEIRRGVVFINETVPYKVVAWVANLLYKEHYTAIPTRHEHHIRTDMKTIIYHWKIKREWNNISVEAGLEKFSMAKGSFEEFIFEHYYGYTRVDEKVSIEYEVKHPAWDVYKINAYNIECDFKAMYGKDFEFLEDKKPDSVFLAEGSAVSVKWKRNRF